jgi:hypothetical protein
VSPNRLPSLHPACIAADADWRQSIAWWDDPRLAYAAGVADGVAIGRAQVDAELVAALAQALGGEGCTDYRQGVTRHLRAISQKERRQASDRGELAA